MQVIAGDTACSVNRYENLFDFLKSGFRHLSSIIPVFNQRSLYIKQSMWRCGGVLPVFPLGTANFMSDKTSFGVTT